MKKIAGVLTVISIFLIILLVTAWHYAYPLKYKDVIIDTAQQYDLDPKLIAAIINAESSFDKNKVSNKNAIGLMQILPSTAEYISDEENVNLFDPNLNIKVGVKYLAYLIEKFDDVDTALFAYNAGEGNVTRWLNAQCVKRLKSCPYPETNAYVKKIKHSVKFYIGRI